MEKKRFWIIIQPQRGDGKGRLENHRFVSWGQFKYLMGVFLSISGGGDNHLADFLRCGRVWREWGSLGCNFHQNIPDFLGIWMPGAG